jgi:copper chaperone
MDGSMDKLTMQITGMTCGHCVAGVTRALKGVPGVTVDQVVLGTASVEYDSTATTPASIARAVEEEGYHVVSAA